MDYFINTFINYYESMFRHIPIQVFQIVLCAVFISVVLIIYFKGQKRCREGVALTLLSGYIFLLVSYTVIFRIEGKNTGVAVLPFWSYASYYEGTDSTLLGENIMNVVAFMPIGFLLCIARRHMSLRGTLIIGGLLSAGIEIAQIVFKRGFCETDDVIHNVLGCLLGYMIIKLPSLYLEKYCRKAMVVREDDLKESIRKNV